MQVLIRLAITYVIVDDSQVSGGGEFQLLLTSFRNEAGLAADGRCCESDSVSMIGRCSSPCRTFFRVCLSHYQAEILPDVPCTYGEWRTDVVGDNSFDIPLSGLDTQGRSNESSADVGFNPVRIPFRFSWPVGTDAEFKFLSSFFFVSLVKNSVATT